MLSLWSTLFVPLYISAALADLLGPRYPAPLDLTSPNSLVAAAWQNLTNTFNAHVNGSARSPLLNGVENITFSFGAFSIHDPQAQSLQYHYASPEVTTSQLGVNRVDGNSLYRVASVTKLFTVFAGMLSLTEEQWNRPFTQIFPALATFMNQHAGQNSSVTITRWDQVTPWNLAAQLSGVSANTGIFEPNDLYLSYIALTLANSSLAVDPVTYGLPPLNMSDPLLQTACTSFNSSCTGDLYLVDASTQIPLHLPWASPGYSNNGFILLGIALSALTGKPLPDLYRDTVFQPLGLNSTYLTEPTSQTNRSVLPGGTTAGFFLNQSVSSSSGGIFSTLNDLAKFSTGVLNSTLMPAEKTRKWMKPITHTANLHYSVGAPWEILRYTYPAGSASAGVVTDLYTKLGDSGNYGGVALLIPEYGAGFNLICGSALPQRSTWMQLVLDGVVRSLLPALEAQAAAEAAQNFAGTYASNIPNLNSTITLAVNPSVPGLSVTQWISNSTDVLNYTTDIFGAPGSIRLVPTIAETGTPQYAFRVLRADNQTAANAAMAVGPFTGQLGANLEWLVTDATTYLGQAVDLVVFDVNGSGNATALNIPAFKSRMTRQR